ncbi:protein of unknown function [Oscillibacter sp. PC13]|uniref:DUF4349 domain-containing protein n=1 Tax=Oscillibacter sp. PC13 TaxID=1855299 RepID=UPI0008E12C9A|nr:DUF4349 domain-containing protein [Oscillibacter sp. PC13]SFP33792.1 protein of unknown function [Oscillibacter sp. PC13]
MLKKRLIPLMAVLLLVGVLSSCGSGSGGTTASSNGAMDTMTADMAPAEAEEDAGGYYGGMETQAASQAQKENGTAVQTEKLIYTGTLEMETTAFDGAMADLERLVADCGGYLESSSVSSRGSGYRYANYTVRVPAAQYRTFYTQAGEMCHVTWQDQSAQNITTAYYDTEGRLKTQQTKLERLQELLSRAESMEDIITIESAISETEQQIESLSGELRHYDALVDYATVYISLQEVYKLSNVEEPATGFASRMGTALSSGWKSFVDGMESLLVALAYGWMWLLVLAVIVTAVVCRLRKRKAAPGSPEKKPPFWPPHSKDLMEDRDKKTDDKQP